ncbi:MAG: hypothetical protein C6P37_11235 [Caldibacillus debilis]|uniref:Uncharacterized protein n=1 Tax=Caldibacillus debilis TaxID=301148 RepID=A0A3E0K3M0_9BACI|nr:MAG: hypothetical protein C6P37_11235 [Caldibacillus debilis]
MQTKTPESRFFRPVHPLRHDLSFFLMAFRNQYTPAKSFVWRHSRHARLRFRRNPPFSCFIFGCGRQGYFPAKGQVFRKILNGP